MMNNDKQDRTNVHGLTANEMTPLGMQMNSIIAAKGQREWEWDCEQYKKKNIHRLQTIVRNRYHEVCLHIECAHCTAWSVRFEMINVITLVFLLYVCCSLTCWMQAALISCLSCFCLRSIVHHLYSGIFGNNGCCCCWNFIIALTGKLVLQRIMFSVLTKCIVCGYWSLLLPIKCSDQ